MSATIEQLIAAGQIGPFIGDDRELGAAPVLGANLDAVIAVPYGARSMLIWFESPSLGLVRGRYAWDTSDTPVAVTSTSLGYLPAQASTHNVPIRAAFLHVACHLAATAYITWLF